MKYEPSDYRECLYNEIDCPYYDSETCMCTMYAEEGTEPSEECDG